MSTLDTPRHSAAWLGLREDADATARATDLLDPLRDQLPDMSPLVVCDLGAGTGAMGRWLARHLPGRQHWILWDRDPVLLRRAATTMVDTAADGAAVTVATRQADIAELTADDLTGAGLVTASALLDLLTRDQVDRIAAACVAASCPALLTLSVTGEVELTPPDPLDAELAATFNSHQRRRTGGHRLLGPDAVDAAERAFTRRDATVLARPSPWRLGPDQSALMRQWLRSWVAAACAQRPDLTGAASAYLERRLAAVDAGELRVVVGHQDLLAYRE
jgi:hypothetical protein